MDTRRLEAELSGTVFGDVRWTAETGSTNSDLLAMAREGAPEGRVVIADHQVAGRGRAGRSWTAPAGGSLLVSMLFRPRVDADVWGLFPLAAGLAVCDGVERIARCRVGLKWPNDIVADAVGGVRKLGGVLCETEVVNGSVDALVVGFGCNINWPTTLPPELEGIATSLNVLQGEPLERHDVLVAILQSMHHRYQQVIDPGERNELMNDYRARCRTIGDDVVVDSAGRSVDGLVEGRVEDVASDGSLVLRTAPDETVYVRVGDVHSVRARP